MADNFQIFSKIHIYILMSISTIIILMYAFRELIYKNRHKELIGYILALILFIVRASEQLLSISKGKWSIKSDLPLHLCGITSVLCIIMLICRNYSLFEVLYFWGLIGSPAALIIPAGLSSPYNSLAFWQFIIAHTLNIISVLYMIFAYKYRPRVKSIWKTFFVTNIYMAFIAAFNYIVGSNYYYFYLCSDPSPRILNPFKSLNSWPSMLIVLEAVTFILILLFYSPYAVMDNRKISKMHSVHI